MNAEEILTNVTLTPTATTSREATTALARKDSLEMDKIARVCFMFEHSIFYFEQLMKSIDFISTKSTCNPVQQLNDSSRQAIEETACQPCPRPCAVG